MPKFFKPEEDLIVGDYMPSDNWNKYTHFAVMGERTDGMVASCGYFNKLTEPNVFGLKDYLYAAHCIEQAQLMANAHKLLDACLRLLEDPCCPEAQARAHNAIDIATSIEEPVKRLLGPNAMKIIEEAEKRCHG